MLRVLPGPFGAAEVVDLQVDEFADGSTRDMLRAALANHAVVCVRQSRALDDDEASVRWHRCSARSKTRSGATRDGGELRYSDDRQIIDAGFVLTDELREQLGDVYFGGDSLRPGLFETFHTDDSYTERPAAATVLHALRAPVGSGRQHMFHRHARRVPTARTEPTSPLEGPPSRAQLQQRWRVPAPHCRRRAVRSARRRRRIRSCAPIPITGEPALYLDLDRATHVEGMPEDEGRALLRSLQDHAEACAPRTRTSGDRTTC